MSKRLRPLAMVSAALLPLVAVAYYSTTFQKWGYFFSDANGFRYLDTRTITSNVSCSASDPGWSIDKPTACHPLNWIMNYPKAWFTIFDFLGWDDEHVMIPGVLITCCFIVTLGTLIAYMYDAKPAYLCLIILSVSPPVFFALERGNTDAFIFFLIGMSTILMSHYSRFSKIAGVCLLSMAAYLKIFPLGAFLSLLLVPGYRGRRLLPWIVAGVSICALILLALIPEAGRIYANTPQYPSQQFGLRTLPAELLHCIPSGNVYGYCNWSDRAEFGVGLGIFAILLFLIWLLFSESKAFRSETAKLIERLFSDRFGALVIANFGGAFLFAFMLGTNWYYRLIFLIPVAAICARTKTRMGYLLTCLIIAACYGMIGNAIYLTIASQFTVMLVAVFLAWLGFLVLKAEVHSDYLHTARVGRARDSDLSQ